MPDDHSVAAELATGAGQLLLEVRARLADGDPKQLRDEGDQRSHDYLMQRLAEVRPDDAVLSEEGRDDAHRTTAKRVWIVDPLDGTREFSELERDDWAVHVALWQDGELAAGAVALPAQDVTLRTGGAGGQALSSQPAGDRPRLLVSRTRPPAVADDVAAALDAELVPMGSAGAKIAAVIQGVGDVYVHAGGQYEWDSAAPVAVAREAGLFTSRLDGSPLVYNRADPLLPDLVVCRPELADRVLAAIHTAA